MYHTLSEEVNALHQATRLRFLSDWVFVTDIGCALIVLSVVVNRKRKWICLIGEVYRE